MDETWTPGGRDETQIIDGRTVLSVTVRYWASARAEAGVAQEDIVVEGPVSLADLVERADALHPGTRLHAVLGACSVLLGEQPVSSADPASVVVPPGSSVEFLPPFAGG